MLLEDLEITPGDQLKQSDFQEIFEQGATGKGIEIRYDDKNQKYIWLFAREGGRYEDNIEGERFRYIGEDPQGPGIAESTELNQELTRGNKELRNAIETPLPIFLFYQSEDRSDWEYRGQVEVISCNYRPDDGRHVYEFTLEIIETEKSNQLDERFRRDEEESAPDLNGTTRSEMTVSRIIRNTTIVKELKSRYNNKCQVCDEQRQGTDGTPYSEGHHLRPLGRPHNGSDNAENILILCPNHHADFDYGRLRVDPKSLMITHLYDDEIDNKSLTMQESHSISSKSLKYHNRLASEK